MYCLEELLYPIMCFMCNARGSTRRESSHVTVVQASLPRCPHYVSSTYVDVCIDVMQTGGYSKWYPGTKDKMGSHAKVVLLQTSILCWAQSVGLTGPLVRQFV